MEKTSIREVQRKKMSEMVENESGVILSLKAETSMKERFLALGMAEGVRIKCVFSSFSQDPIAFEICDCMIAIRKEDIKEVIVEVEKEDKIDEKKESYTILLAGNPNVGKSTLFNKMTGLHQHTGNWTGKTVEIARGIHKEKDALYEIYDLPGTYSLHSRSEEEKEAEYCLRKLNYDVVIVVCDASCLKRNLLLVFEIMNITSNMILCVNLLDEAKKKGIEIQFEKLEERLKIPVVGCVARTGVGIEELLEQCKKIAVKKERTVSISSLQTAKINEEQRNSSSIAEIDAIMKEVITKTKGVKKRREEELDQILTQKKTGIPIMLLLLFGIFWITMKGANGPSEFLATAFESLGEVMTAGLLYLQVPKWLVQFFMNGIYQVTSFVISVMLPPMAIFFPLFTILEDYGFLPRIAFNLDHMFQKCHACGKQALTMCMGFGCSAVGVTGCRIIDSKRERLIAILTNCFVPCNGKFPTLVAMIGVGMMMLGRENSFFGAVLLTLFILLGVGMTFFASYLLSITVLKGVPSAFTLELPPYRRPQFGKVFLRSFFERTLFVLKRAVFVAIPAGILLFFAGNFSIMGSPLTVQMANFFDPFGKLLGLDGVIITAFLFGFPANEIVVPIMLMLYLSTGNLVEFGQIGQLEFILRDAGWTIETVFCVCLFMLFHYPCSTTLWTIKKETKSWVWTGVAFFLPTAVGIFLCMSVHFIKIFITMVLF